MEVFTDMFAHVLSGKSTVALGFFDGVHLGHRAVLRAAFEEPDLLPTVFTFSSINSMPPSKQNKFIYNDKMRVRLLEECGARVIYMPPFADFGEMDAEAFVLFLYQNLHAQVLTCGEDYRFSKNAGAGVEILKNLCAPLGIKVKTIGPVIDAEGKRISSTQIRSYLRKGMVERAAKVLGAPYRITGTVCHGEHLGRQLGFPTINIAFEQRALLPQFGVYASRVKVGNRVYEGVTNIGVKPTIGANFQPLAETYLLDYNGDLYNTFVEVELHAFVRTEKRFSNIEQLKEQISADRKTVQQILHNS